MATDKTPESLRRPTEIMQDPKGVLAKLFKQTSHLLAMQDVVRQFVPPNVKVASFQDKTLHLVTPSGAAATQIKYRQRSIISAIRKLNTTLDVQNVKVSVRPEPPQRTREYRLPTPVSEDSAQQLASTAQYIEDEALRKALIKLSNRKDLD